MIDNYVLLLHYLVNIASGGGLLTNDPKQLPVSILSYHHWVLLHLPEDNFTRNVQGIYPEICLKITNVKLQPHLQIPKS